MEIQNIVFDLSIISLDIAKLVHKKNVALITLKLKAFPGIFLNIPWNLLEHSPESLIAFPGIFYNIPRNLLEHSRECSKNNIPRNPLGDSPES